MIVWIESQDTFVIGLLAFALCYAIGAAVFGLSRLVARTGRRAT